LAAPEAFEKTGLNYDDTIKDIQVVETIKEGRTIFRAY